MHHSKDACLHDLGGRSGTAASVRTMRCVHSHRPFTATTPGRRPRCYRAVRVCSSTDEYVAAVLECEQQGDAMRALEVLTEVKVLKLQLPHHATEAGIRTFAAGGQWRRAHDLFSTLRASGHQPGPTTISAVFEALAEGKQVELTVQLLQELSNGSGEDPSTTTTSSSSSSSVMDLSGPYNMAIRACAAVGEFDTALKLLEQAMAAEHLRLTNNTFTFLASELLKAGEAELAEEVLDYRDYL